MSSNSNLICRKHLKASRVKTFCFVLRSCVYVSLHSVVARGLLKTELKEVCGILLANHFQSVLFKWPLSTGRRRLPSGDTGTKWPLFPLWGRGHGGCMGFCSKRLRLGLCEPGSEYLRLVVTCLDCSLNSQTCLGRRLGTTEGLGLV